MLDSFQTKKTLTVGGRSFEYFSLPDLARRLGLSCTKLPFSHLVLLENLLRKEDGVVVKKEDVEFLAKLDPTHGHEREIQFQPARVLLQDFTGVPVVADLAAIREAVVRRGGAWEKVNPLQQVDLVVDHSVQVDVFARPDAVQENTRIEFERNLERYRFLKWGQQNFRNLRIVPPAMGICHQVNMEYLARGVWIHQIGSRAILSPDSVIGTDSHTPMVNSLGVLGWGVGGIEAEAAMLGQPISLLIPPVIGFHLTGRLPAGVTATDLVLNVTQILRKKGVVGKFVEFFGEGLSSLSAADRATVSNMAPEYGAPVGIFPPDEATLAYFRATGRTEAADMIQAYYQAQGMWKMSHRNQYQDLVELDLSSLDTSMAGPSKPHERVSLAQAPASFTNLVEKRTASPGVPLIGFVSSEERWVTANFKETEIESVKIGAKVKIEVDALSGKTFEGSVAAISAATGATFTLLPPDNATGNFTKVVQRVPVKILFSELSESDISDLRAGLSAYVKVRKH
jgi:aconitate hydratase